MPGEGALALELGIYRSIPEVDIVATRMDRLPVVDVVDSKQA